MRKLHFSYGMRLEFDRPVWDHSFALRCVPSASQKQQIVLETWRIEPDCRVDEVRDSFGNLRYVGHIEKPHDFFAYEVKGVARVRSMMVEKGPLQQIYRYPSEYTRPEPVIRKFYSDLGTLEGDTLSRAVFMMEALYREFSYVPGSTDIRTTAAGALEQRKGVCQDYAHILISLCRLAGIPARYVAGLMIGEGYSHAWVEIYRDGGWYGLDPTNNLHIDDYYIKLAHGRDYGDCMVDWGVFRGCTGQEQKVYVNVEEIQ